MLNNSDINKLKEIFISKEDFVKFEAKLSNKFVTKDEFLSGFDALMFELKAIREELTMGGYRRSENAETLENHEDKITSVEKKLSF